MELKRILASDTNSARELAIKQYGRDVLVISNHTVDGQTELVVALDLDEQVGAASVRPGPESVDCAEPGQSFRRQLVLAQDEAADPALETESVAVQGAFGSALQQTPFVGNREIMELIRDELASLRREFSLSQKTSPWRSNLKLSHAVDELMNSFSQAGMPTGLRTLLLDTVKDMRSEQEALQAIRQQLEQVVRRPGLAWPQSGIHLIAGPSGVGKTSMAVRLASHAIAQNATRKVALLSYRDDRLGAYRQTQTVAAQAGIECFRADSASALSTLLRTLGGYDLVLIDTTATQLAERVAEIVSVCPSCMLHALVAADSSTATLRRTLGDSGVRWSSLMVSKLDESVAPWPLVEFLCDNFLPLSAASQGPQVGALKLDLSTNALIEMAMSQLSALPEQPLQIRTTRMPTPELAMLSAQAPRFFMPASPRGLRGPFN